MSAATPGDTRDPEGGHGGGIAARRAIVRWAWRLFRREWRQQALVLALLTVVVAAALAGSAAAYNLAPAPDAARFGTATHYLRFDVDEAGAQALPAVVAAAEEHFGVVDVITRRSEAVAGSVESVEFRAQDPLGAHSGPMLALRQGRYPSAPGEVAVTDGVAEMFGLDVGSAFSLGGKQTVVGLVENPSDLGDEFALVAPAYATPQSATLLVSASAGRVASFRPPDGSPGFDIAERQEHVEVFAAVGVLAVAIVALMLVALVASASFVVMARRRQRQLGMFAAIGATEQHLRLVMLAGGAITGMAGGVLGLALAALAWVALVPLIEPGVGRRVDVLNVPWWLVGAVVLIAAGASMAAAWWPARALTRQPITAALAGRPPAPAPARRVSGMASLLIAGGLACLIAGDPAGVAGESGQPFGSIGDALLLAGGAVLTVLGILLAGPLAIRLAAAGAAWMPVAVRLAVRDLARYQARSGAALAAIALALGIAAAIAVLASAAEDREHEGNVSATQLLVWTRDPAQPEGVSPYYTEDSNDSGSSPYLPRLTPADIEEMGATVERLAASLDGAAVTGIDLAFDPVAPPTEDGMIAATLARPMGDGLTDVALLFVATPALLAHYGVDIGDLPPQTEFLTVEEGELWLPGLYDPDTERYRRERVEGAAALEPGYSSLPASFITPAALARRGWASQRVGWLIDTGSPITSEQRAAAREVAAGAGLLVEARREQASLATLRSGATVAGVLVALSVLAMTVGLIRSETAGDLRTLTATGATSGVRRALTAATAGALALAGGVLGIAGAYAILAAGSAGDLGELTTVPVVHLLAIAAGVPLAAGLSGWLLAGREPRGLARPPGE